MESRLRKQHLQPFAGLVCAVFGLAAATGSADDALWKLYAETAKKAAGESRGQTAIVMYLAAWEEAQQFAADDERLPRTAKKLADVYVSQQRYEEAIPYYDKALALLKRRGAIAALDVAECLSSLAFAYFSLERYAKADPLFQEALKIRTETQGPEHQAVAEAMLSLANNFRFWKQYDKAEPLFRQALKIKEDRLGPADPDVARTRANLAHNYFNQGKFAEAEPLYREALAVCRQTLGSQHASVAVALTELAETLAHEKKFKEAGPLYNEAYEIRRAQEPSGSATMESLGRLAGYYYNQGRYAAAERCYRELLNLQRSVLGARTTATAGTLHTLGLVLVFQAKFSEAEPFLRNALEIREDLLASDHPDTIAMRGNLAYLNFLRGNLDEAANLYRDALKGDPAGAEAVLDTVEANYAILLYAQGEKKEGEERFAKALEKLRKREGERALLAWRLTDMASQFLAAGEPIKAETLFKEAIDLREQSLAADHADKISSFEGYAKLLRAAGRTSEAEVLENRVKTIRDREKAEAEGLRDDLSS